MNAAHPDSEAARLEVASGWCLRVSEGPLDPGEQAGFDAWLAEEPDNLAAFERAVGVWQQFGHVASAPEFIDVRERALAVYRQRNQRRWRRPPPVWRVLGGIAASLALMLAGALWYASRPDVYQTRIGERRIVMLGDGSRVSLDAATEVDVRLGADRRELDLRSGRAKFDVAKDPLRPFSVRVGDKLVVATGTSFSVELVHGKVHVILYEGQVAVLETSGGGRAVPVKLQHQSAPADRALKPGGELVTDLARSFAAVAPADVPRSLSWEGGQLVFVDEPLSLAIGRVNRYAGTPLEIEGSAGQLQLNGVFNAGDVDAFLVGVEETLPVKVSRTAERITIARK